MSHFYSSILPLIISIFSFFIVPSANLQTEPLSRQVALGAWTQGLFDHRNKKLQPENLLDFENLIGKKVQIAHYYIGWEALDSPEILTQFELLQSHGWQPMISVNPYFFDKCRALHIPIYRAIAEGKCDEFLINAGKNLSRVKKPVFLVFAWEMNNKQNEWSVPYTRSTPGEFVAAWRHIHGIFKSENAKNIIWVFCPNVPNDPIATYGMLYPGDGFVDWIGLDGYNWGKTQSWSDWVSFSGVFTASYNLITSIAPSKPLVIAEVNTTDKGGDKGGWYKDMFVHQIPQNFPKVLALVIFNEDRTRQENVNWRVDVTQESLEAFKSAIKAEYYK